MEENNINSAIMIKKGFDETTKLVQHKKRIEKIEEELKELKGLLAIG